MKFNNKQNEAIETKDGNILWKSRSIAVCALIITEDDKALIAQRSDKVDHAGKWALPCGYLDWNESIHQALLREVWEEVGLDITCRYACLYHVNDAPNKDEKQNITFHFIIPVPETSEELSKKINLCEESTQFDFISKQDIRNKNFGDREFAFNHDERLYRTVTAVVDEFMGTPQLLDPSEDTQFTY